MSLAAARQNYVDLSSIASTVARQLCFAGIAVIWIFAAKNGSDGGAAINPSITYTLPNDMLQPLKLFILALALDLLHYIVAAAIWGIYHRYKENELGEDSTEEFGWPRCINWPANFFFLGKLFFTMLGYMSLLSVIYGFLSPTS